MELLIQFVLLFLVVTQLGGARVLDDDSSQKNAHIEEKLSSGQSPGVGHMSLQYSHGEQLLSSGQSPIEGILSSGQSPGVGHMSLQHSHGEVMMSMGVGQVPSGESPGVGHLSVQNAQIEEMLPSGSSPGVGHMSIHSTHIKGKLSSGQSQGVGHVVAQDAHIDGMLSSGQSLAEIDSGKKLSGINKLPSGPSPGVGHMVINSQKSRDKNPAVSNILAGETALNEIPSPEADNSSELGYVVGSRTEEKTDKSADHVDQIAVNEESVTLNEILHSNEQEGQVKEESVTLNEVPAGKIHSKEQEGQVGSMETSLSARERPENGHSLVEKSPGIIGCPDVGEGSGSINLFHESTYYGAPTPLFFRVEQ